MKLTELALHVAPARPQQEANPTDTVTMNVPLMIRLMEYAKEDAADDMALHSVSERLIDLASEGRPLTMDDYDAIVGGQQEQLEKSSKRNMVASQENEEVNRKQAKIAQLKKDYADKMRWSKEEKAQTGRDRSGHYAGAMKIKDHLKKQYGVDV